MDELVFFTLDESFVEFHGGGGPSFFEPSLHSLIWLILNVQKFN